MDLTWKNYKKKNRTYIVFTDLAIPIDVMIATANRQYFKKNPSELFCTAGYLDNKGQFFASNKYVEGCKQVVWAVTKR